MDDSIDNKNIISKRAEVVSVWEDFLNKYMNICNANEYDEIKNPEGYINLGTAVNNMCHDVILPRLTSSEVWHCDQTLLQYKEGYGIESLRKGLANLMTKFFDPYEPINPEDLFCTVGVTSSIDLLVHCIAEPGDAILAPTPIYPRIYTDFKQRSGVLLWPIPIITDEVFEEPEVLTIEKVREAYLNAMARNQVVKGIFLINPSNPMGDIYSSDLLMEILEFCKEHQLHAIIDEVYALSVFLGSAPFHSVLKFPRLPDVERTHVLYGLSKDLGIAGLRVGAIHTKNKVLQRCLIQLSFFQTIPFPIMGISAKLIEDIDWCQKYFKINQQRLTEKFTFCVTRLKKMGLSCRNSAAAFFVWVNFREVCNIDSFEKETEFFLYLMEKACLYIVPGKELFCPQPGWFRITFSSKPDHVNEGLNRLENAIMDYKTFM